MCAISVVILAPYTTGVEVGTGLSVVSVSGSVVGFQV